MRMFFALLLLAGAVASASPLRAQSEDSATEPYATLDRQAVTYRGPVNSAESDSPNGYAVIGIIVPLQGARREEGEALLAAVQLAIEQEQARHPLPNGRKLALVVRDESGPWGQASSEILKLIQQDHALVLLTSADGNIAHQAEQLANKISFPILTLASDPTTTQANVPWLFRLGPSDADQARAFCRRIYMELGLRKVLLIAQSDHDGRIGSSEFEKAARELKAPDPELLEVSAAAFDTPAIGRAIQAKEPEAVVAWTDAARAGQLLELIHTTRPSIPVFLSTKAAQLGSRSQDSATSTTPMAAKQNLGESFTVVSLPAGEEATRREFETAYRSRTGSAPGIVALQAYEAVHLVATGLRTAGANRILLRDYFASEGKFHDPAASVLFDPAGNCAERFTVVKLAAMSAASGL